MILFLYQTLILWELPLSLSMVITVVFMSIVGLLVNLALFTPLRKFQAKELHILIATIALSIFLKNLMRLIWKSKPLSINTIFSKQPVNVLGASVMPSTFWILGVSIVLMTLLYILSQKTKFGVAMRAAAENKQAASLMGISVDKAIGFAFAISLVSTAVAGILSTSVLYLIPEMGDSISTKAFAATIIGGLGHPVGANVGGILLGDRGKHWFAGFASKLQNAVTFLILIAFPLFNQTACSGRPLPESVGDAALKEKKKCYS